MSHNDSGHACACGGSCGCNSSQEAEENFLTREEYIARLEQYLVDLKTEIAAVEVELFKMRQPA